ncbi:GSCOCG00010048001-RA-CDS [Cotesia congregata]|nr:GSCOCG00010048001-RA-CDS [Cotesia congregata]
MKKAKKSGLLNVLNDWDDGKDFFRKIISLALLPSHQIIPAFKWLLTVYSAFQPAFHQFLQYFQSYWLETVKPENFSVFGCLEKTNNYVESNNRRLNVEFGIHPCIWDFTKKLMELYERSKIELESMMMGLPIRRQSRLNYLIKEAVLIRAWDLYNNNVLDFKHFLECTNKFLTIFENDQGLLSVDEVDTFINFKIQMYIAINEKLYIAIDEIENNVPEHIIFIHDN